MKILIDGDGLVYTYGYAAQKKAENGEVDLLPFSTIAGLLDFKLAEIMRECNTDGFEIYLDGGSNFRNNVATIVPYKGNRDRGSRPIYYPEIRKYLTEYYGAIAVQDQEPDDVLGIEATKDPENTIISTLDKDLNMIPGNHYNWMKGNMYTVSQEEGDRFFWMQCISGDKCDNIPSIYQQLMLQGNDKLANTLKRGSYLKKSQIALDLCESYATMKLWVEEYYTQAGLPLDNLSEVGKLLWIRRQEGEEWAL